MPPSAEGHTMVLEVADSPYIGERPGIVLDPCRPPSMAPGFEWNDLGYANLQETKNLTQEQLKSAKINKEN